MESDVKRLVLAAGVVAAALNLAHGISHSVGRGCTSGGDHVARSAQAETNAKFAGESSHDPGGNAEQAHGFVLLMKEEAVLLFGELLRAST